MKRKDYRNEREANAALFAMKPAHTKADHDTQVKRAALISEILRDSFLRHVSIDRL